MKDISSDKDLTVKKFREINEITQAKMASDLGISKSYLSKIENTGATPKEMAEKISVYCGGKVSIEKVLFPNKKVEISDLPRALKKGSFLPEEIRERVASIAR